MIRQAFDEIKEDLESEAPEDKQRIKFALLITRCHQAGVLVEARENLLGFFCPVEGCESPLFFTVEPTDIDALDSTWRDHEGAKIPTQTLLQACHPEDPLLVGYDPQASRLRIFCRTCHEPAATIQIA
jgi:hypothetical protein